MINSIAFLSEFIKFFFSPLKAFNVHDNFYVVIYACLITYAVYQFIRLINKYVVGGALWY